MLRRCCCWYDFITRLPGSMLSLSPGRLRLLLALECDVCVGAATSVTFVGSFSADVSTDKSESCAYWQLVPKRQRPFL